MPWTGKDLRRGYIVPNFAEGVFDSVADIKHIKLPYNFGGAYVLFCHAPADSRAGFRVACIASVGCGKPVARTRTRLIVDYCH